MDWQLLDAIANNDLKRVRYILKKGTINNIQYFNRVKHHIHGAVYFKQALKSSAIDIAKLIIDNGLGINSRFENGDTPLIKAVKVALVQNKYDFVELLIESGADIEIYNDAGYNALHIAAQMSDVVSAKLLVEKGGARVSVSLKDSGKTCLHLLAKDNVGIINNKPDNILEQRIREIFIKKHIEFVDMLIENGLEIDRKDFSGVTPLMDAAKYCNSEMVKIYLERGANPNEKDDKFGYLPLNFVLNSKIIAN